MNIPISPPLSARRRIPLRFHFNPFNPRGGLVLIKINIKPNSTSEGLIKKGDLRMIGRKKKHNETVPYA